MLIGVTTTGKIVLALAAGLFIVFALVSSFVLPRRDPDFPGNRLGAFTAVTVLLFLVVMGAMFVFAGASDENAAGGGDDSSQPAGVATETTGGGTTEAPPADEGAEGDAAAGEGVFAANGCGSCHVLESAGASGAVGPNLDESQPGYELTVDRVTNGAGSMPAYGDQLSEEQIADVAAYVVASTGG